ncbi:hypothetical protein B0H13DRAFT_2364569 [Mycena leptocephala]|nr:hypothetical protein B0H13DRAFT_2364569 [Mycena leptocephala]
MCYLQMGNVARKHNSARDSVHECLRIEVAWAQRDRSQIHSYAEFLAARGQKESKIACSKAIANRRSALRPGNYSAWIRGERTPYQDANSPARNLYGWGITSGGSHTTTPAEVAVLVLSQTGWGSGPGRAQTSGWGNSHVGWGYAGWPGERDPLWDGITPVPKLRGKKKRRRQRLREGREALAAARAYAESEARRYTLEWEAEHPYDCMTCG